jgi:hypothetical protein
MQPKDFWVLAAALFLLVSAASFFWMIISFVTIRGIDPFAWAYNPPIFAFTIITTILFAIKKKAGYYLGISLSLTNAAFGLAPGLYFLIAFTSGPAPYQIVTNILFYVVGTAILLIPVLKSKPIFFETKSKTQP